MVAATVPNPPNNSDKPAVQFNPLLLFLLFPALVLLRFNFGSKFLTPKHVVLGGFALKIYINVSEFLDKSAGTWLPLLLWAYVAAASCHLLKIALRQQAPGGDPISPDSSGRSYLSALVPLIRRKWPNPPQLVATALDRPGWVTACYMEPLVLIVAVVGLAQAPQESDACKVLAGLAAILFLAASAGLAEPDVIDLPALSPQISAWDAVGKLRRLAVSKRSAEQTDSTISES